MMCAPSPGDPNPPAKWSKREFYSKRAGIYISKQQIKEQKRALVLEPESSTAQKLASQLDKISARFIF